MEIVVAVDDPHQADMMAIVQVHLDFCYAVTPALENMYALDVKQLCAPGITVFSARRRGSGELLGIGALRKLNSAHGELKCMHTLASARGLGVAKAILQFILEFAQINGLDRVSLETKQIDAAKPARLLYASFGFTPCGAFGDYPHDATSVYMTREL
jgi:putative acetyltransferase